MSRTLHNRKAFYRTPSAQIQCNRMVGNIIGSTWFRFGNSTIHSNWNIFNYLHIQSNH